MENATEKHVTINNPADISVIISYFVVVIAVGIWVSEKPDIELFNSTVYCGWPYECDQIYNILLLISYNSITVLLSLLYLSLHLRLIVGRWEGTFLPVGQWCGGL